jgi:DNA-binding winged helix-turn-helix (wHTH) protein
LTGLGIIRNKLGINPSREFFAFRTVDHRGFELTPHVEDLEQDEQPEESAEAERIEEDGDDEMGDPNEEKVLIDEF